jgi:outer membrane protein assembly factor BamB
MPKGRLPLPVAVTATLLIAVNLAFASDWTRFRGPNGTGIADDKDIPVQWSAKNILWKVEVAGLGHSSPIVWKDHLYVQTASKDGKERILLCLDTKDGSTRWKRSMPARPVQGKGKKKLIHEKNSFASSSPGVDAERVYVVFWDNVNIFLNAYTHAGEPVWSRDLGPFTSQHGAGASPIPIGDKVYFANDSDDNAVLLCLDGRTGATVWSQDRPHFRACYSSPFLRELPNGEGSELIVVSTMGVTGYDPDKGSKRWNWEWKFIAKQPLRTTGSPVTSNGMLFACSGDGGGPRHAVAVKLGTTPTLAWENHKDFPYVPTILAWGK